MELVNGMMDKNKIVICFIDSIQFIQKLDYTYTALLTFTYFHVQATSVFKYKDFLTIQKNSSHNLPYGFHSSTLHAVYHYIHQPNIMVIRRSLIAITILPTMVQNLD